MNYSTSRRKKITDLSRRYRAITERLVQERKEHSEAKEYQVVVEIAHNAIQTIAKEIQEKAHRNIARVVTRCLQAIWGDLYEFRIDFSKKRGKTEARLVFVRKDGLVLDPLDESSGGVVDVASFALRLASITMSQPSRRRLVVLDEPFKNVRGKENQEKVRSMIEQVCRELDFQLIINTDMPIIQSGTIVSLE